MSKRSMRSTAVEAIVFISLVLMMRASEVSSAPRNGEVYQVAVVMVGPVNDLGWSSQHNLGRIALEASYGGLVKTYVFENVPDAPLSKTQQYFEQLLTERDWDMIIGTSYNFQTAMYELTRQHPEIYFLHISGDLQDGDQTPSNWGLGFGRIHQARYLSGWVAGLMTETNHVGNIAAVPIAETFTGVNAFFAGLRDANPQAQLTVIRANVWVDPELELYQARYLLDRYPIDVLAQDTDSYAGQFEAASRNIYSVGYNTDGHTFVSDTVLASAIWDWQPLYRHFTDIMISGQWRFDNVWASLADGIPKLSPFSILVPADVQQRVREQEALFLNGTKREVFCGAWAAWLLPPEQRDNVTDATCLSDSQILTGILQLHPDIDDIGYVPIPETRIDIPTGMLVATQVLAGIALFIFAVFLVLVLHYRNKVIIHAASPPFLITSLVGSITMMITVFTLSPQPPTDALCNVSYWLLCVGFGLFYAGLLTKTWRIAYILRASENFRMVTVPAMTLAGAILAVVLGEVVLLILFSAIETPEVDRSTENLGAHEYRLLCSYSGAASVLIWVLVGYNALLLMIGVLLTFQTRSLSRVFNESKHLALGIYSFSFCLAVLVPLLAITDDPNAKYLISCLGIIFSTCTAVFSLYGPKFYFIWKHGDFDPKSALSSGSSLKN